MRRFNRSKQYTGRAFKNSLLALAAFLSLTSAASAITIYIDTGKTKPLHLLVSANIYGSDPQGNNHWSWSTPNKKLEGLTLDPTNLWTFEYTPTSTAMAVMQEFTEQEGFSWDDKVLVVDLTAGRLGGPITNCDLSSINPPAGEANPIGWLMTNLVVHIIDPFNVNKSYRKCTVQISGAESR